jgi:peptidylprolyl isomerase
MDFIYKPENANYLNRLAEAQRIQDQNAYMKVIEEIEPTLQAIVDADDSWKYTDEQVEIYSTIGGTPHLDGQYTVFGEVIEGLDVIDKIAAVKTRPGDRPEKDVKMRIEIIK